MTNTIQDLDSPNAIIGYWNDNPNNQNSPMLSKQLFDDEYQQGDTITAYFDSDQPDEGLTEVAYDTNVSYKGNVGFKTDSYNMMKFKNAKLMNEERHARIQQALYNNPNSGAATSIGQTQLRDAATLLRDAYYNRELMALQALQTGKIVSSKTGIRDFHVPEEHIVQTNTPWGNKDSSAIQDIKDGIKKMRNDNATSITYALMNSNTFDKLAKSGDLLQSIGIGKLSNNFAIPASTVSNQFSQLTGLTILTYDTSNLLADDTVILLPSGSLGRMGWGDTAESMGNLDGQSGAQVSRTADGITLVTYRQIDPVGTNVKVSDKSLPSLDKSQNIYIMHVGEDTSKTTGSSNGSNSNSSSNTTGKASGK
ncbi:major capsid protein [Apilactobacillus timberlakei]|uniref:Uncharacterized protein n=1 Tax=Apilactobacillus timberlakei TaxID=2008380 RepID=A0ABY2YVJ5_9LACO|nr:major capsid protein [Apilactobacillus timberlakei]TPR12743.1 hypothetical protein DY048_06955 [Apilactobacillus timberlakei]TPR13626.1 hypothetical protein DY052_07825 [Apilactobacillus timberlakei]